MDLCIIISAYKLSVKDRLIEKFVKLFCDASAEPFRGKLRAASQLPQLRIWCSVGCW